MLKTTGFSRARPPGCWRTAISSTWAGGGWRYKDVLLAYYPSTDPAAYLASMERVAALPASRVFPGHHSLDIQPEILVRIRDAFRSLEARGLLHHGGGQFDYGDFGIWI